MRQRECTVRSRRGESEIAVCAQIGNTCRLLHLPGRNRSRRGIGTRHVVENVVCRSGLQRTEIERRFFAALRKDFAAAAVRPDIIADIPPQRQGFFGGLPESGAGRSIGITGQNDSTVLPDNGAG